MAWSKVVRQCGKPGCTNLQKEPYCPTHKHERDLAYSRSRIRTTMQGATLYDARWRQYSSQYLAASTVCRMCSSRATVVDHIKPHRGDASLFWDVNNHQPLCRPCHGHKTAKHDGGFGNKKEDIEDGK
jgi:5-methylcytosine-specific restriction protein A